MAFWLIVWMGSAHIFFFLRIMCVKTYVLRSHYPTSQGVLAMRLGVQQQGTCSVDALEFRFIQFSDSCSLSSGGRHTGERKGFFWWWRMGRPSTCVIVWGERTNHQTNKRLLDRNDDLSLFALLSYRHWRKSFAPTRRSLAPPWRLPFLFCSSSSRRRLG